MRPLVKNTPTDTKEDFQNELAPYIDSLTTYCHGLGKSKWDGDDLLQETLTKAYLSWKEKDSNMSKAYLFRIASNTWIDNYRKRKTNEEYNQDLSLFAQEDRNSNQTVEAVQVLLRELTTKQRMVLILIDGFGFSAKEVAAKSEETEGAVKAILQRARRKLEGVVHENDDQEQFEYELIHRYVTAIQNGNPMPFIRNFIQEVQRTRMSGSSYIKQQNQQSMSVIGNSYVIICVQLSESKTLFVPFYQMEIPSLLVNIQTKTYQPMVA